jgi:hypothetical protein
MLIWIIILLLRIFHATTNNNKSQHHITQHVQLNGHHIATMPIPRALVVLSIMIHITIAIAVNYDFDLIPLSLGCKQHCTEPALVLTKMFT